MDKDGRWWRETRNGIMEEVFRCPRNPAPLYEPAPTSLAKSALTRILALVALVAPFAIIAGVALFITAVARDRIPSWIPWVMGVICYLLPQSRSRKRARPLRLQRNWITSVCVASGNRARGAVRRLAARGNAALDDRRRRRPAGGRSRRAFNTALRKRRPWRNWPVSLSQPASLRTATGKG